MAIDYSEQKTWLSLGDVRSAHVDVASLLKHIRKGDEPIPCDLDYKLDAIYRLLNRVLQRHNVVEQQPMLCSRCGRDMTTEPDAWFDGDDCLRCRRTEQQLRLLRQ